MALFELIITVIVLLSAYLYTKFKHAFKYFESRGVKTLKPVPFFGNIMESALKKKHMFYKLDEVYKAFPDERIIGLYEFLTPVYMIRDPDIIKQITVKDFDHFVNHRTIVENDPDDVLGSNLAALRDEKWRLMRATLSPAFTGAKMRHMCPFVVECAEQVMAFLNSECSRNKNTGGTAEIEVELKDLYSRFANDVIASTAFGYKVNSLKDRDNNFFTVGKKMTTFEGMQMLKMYLMSVFPKLFKTLNISIIAPDITGFLKNLFTSTIKYREEQGIVRQDMINILMEARKGTLKHENQTDDDVGFATVQESEIGKQQLKAPKWTDNQLAAQAFVFFFAGFDTVSTLLSFTTHELVMNPEVQEKLYKEIEESFPEGSVLTYEKIQNMAYLDMVVSEALRLWSPGVILDRKCQKSFDVLNKDGSKSGLTIDKGTTVYVPVRALSRDPKYWENSKKFDPERFSPENKHKIIPFTYLPFGSGPRNCIGSRYALMEVKIILCYLLRNFELKRSLKTAEELIFPPNKFTMSVENGFWMKFVSRINK